MGGFFQKIDIPENPFSKKGIFYWFIIPFFVFLFLSILFPNHVKASDIIFHEITTSSNGMSSADNYQGQIFYTGTTTNLSKIAFGFGNDTHDITITEIAICKGLLPDLSGVAEWDANAITCNWSGHERILYETNTVWTYSQDFYGQFDFYYELTTPIELETDSYYYFVFKNDANVTYYQQNSSIAGFVPHGSSSGYWDYGTTGPGFQHVFYYDDEFIPPPFTYALVWGYPDPLQATSTFQYPDRKTFPISYDFCEIYNEFDYAMIKPYYSSLNFSPAKTLIYSKSGFIGPQKCKGVFYFEDYYEYSTGGSVYFDIIFQDENGDTLEDLTITSNTRNYDVIYGTEEDGFIYSLNKDPYFVDIGINRKATTTLSFMYDFSGRNIASTTILLYDRLNATTTAQFSGSLTQGIGTGQIEIPTPEYPDFKNFQYLVISEGDNNIKSPVFRVNWNRYLDDSRDLTDDEFEQILLEKCEQEKPLIDLTNLCDNNTGGFLPDLTCNIKQGLVGASNFIFKADCKNLVKFYTSFNDLKRSFPFNFYFDFTDTINIALDTALTSTTTGSIDIPFIRQTESGTEYYAMPIASSTSFINLIGEENYNTFRTTLGFIWWILVALIVFFIVSKL